LIDSYTEGVIEKSEFDVKIKNLRERIKHLESQIMASQKIKDLHHELSLVVNRLEAFAEQVESHINTIEFEKKTRNN